MVTLNPLLFPLISFVVSFAALIAILKSRVNAIALDMPNQRSLHFIPISRLGGVAIVAGILTSFLLAGEVTLLLAVVALSAVSFVDDLRGLKAVLRLVIHVLVIGGYYWVSYADVVPMIILVALIGFAIWLTNLYNFMDGIDGLAGGMAVAGFVSYAAAFFLAGELIWAVVAMCIASASAAFLWFNFHPAKIYMGDAGSITLGFLAAALGTIGWMLRAWPLWFPLLVFSPFVADATVTLIRRALRGEKIWLPHREHYYQKLTMTGLGHKKTALLEYAIIMASCVLALLGLGLTWRFQWLLLVVIFGLYGILFLKIESRWRRFQNEQIRNN